MEQLYYADEVRAFSEVEIGEGEVKDDELKLAVQLIQQAASDKFDPAKYTDEVRARILEQIERKVAGEEIISAPSEEPATQIIDLMAALKQSLAKGTAPDDADTKKTARKKNKAKAS